MNTTRDTLVDTLRKNPVPATVMAVGLVWLLMNRSTSEASRTRDAQHGVGRTADDVGKVVGQLGAAVGKAAHQATDAAGNVLHQASDVANTALHGASDFAGRIATQGSETARGLAHRANDTASQLAHRAEEAATYVAGGTRKGVERVKNGFHTTLRENPVALGTAALALGTVVGFALPRTRGEDVLMGDARDLLVHRVGEVAHDAAASVTRLAEQSAQGAKQSMAETSTARQ